MAVSIVTSTPVRPIPALWNVIEKLSIKLWFCNTSYSYHDVMMLNSLTNYRKTFIWLEQCTKPIFKETSEIFLANNY